MTGIVHFAVDRSQVAAGTKASQTMATFHSHRCLGKVEVALIGQLDDVMMTKEGKSDWEAMNKSNLNVCRLCSCKAEEESLP